MAKRISRKELKQDEFVDAAIDVGQWVEQHKSKLFKGAIGVLVLAVVIVSWISWSRNRTERTEQQVAAAVTSYERALAAGDDGRPELEAVLTIFEDASEAGGASGRLAEFYRGATLFHLGRADEALTALEAVAASSSGEPTLEATAQAMLARVYLAEGREDEAATVITAALDSSNSILPRDQTLLELGRIHAAAGRDDEAQKAWQRVLDEFPASTAATDARQLLGS